MSPENGNILPIGKSKQAVEYIDTLRIYKDGYVIRDYPIESYDMQQVLIHLPVIGWQVIPCSILGDYYDIDFKQSIYGWNGWICALNTGNDTILFTNDGGYSWSKRYSSESFRYISFINDSVGFASDGGYIFSTIDGGITWNTEYNFTSGILDIFFSDELSGWVTIGRQTCLHTIDGGTNWGGAEYYDPYYLNWGMSIYSSNVDSAWVSGGYGNIGRILFTEDGASTWEVQYEDSSASTFNGISFYGSNGWACGRYGNIIKTENLGGNWIKLTSNTTTELNSISFRNAMDGVAVGDSGVIVQTSDGGEKWEEVTGITIKNLNKVAFSSTAFIAVGDSSVIVAKFD